ncbi:MAG TPA: hypothetical protein VGS20_12200 [Candidatus Acidoferrales bacterium]|nr:hypothetical protein [Candidatus Acidoferrales bacterium]
MNLPSARPERHMNRHTRLMLASAILFGALPAAAQSPATSATPASRPVASPATAPPATLVVPAGTKIPLVLENAISTRTVRVGDPVYFETVYPIAVAGHIVIPAGSYMGGEVLAAKRPGRVKGRGQLVLKLSQLILPNGYTVDLEAAPSGAATGGGEQMGKEGEIKGPTSRGDDAVIIVRSTVYGAAIGAAAAGATGAKAGLGAGAAAGLLGVLLTRGPDAELPRGTSMDVVLERPIPLVASRVQFTEPGKAPDLAGPANRQPPRRRVPL